MCDLVAKFVCCFAFGSDAAVAVFEMPPCHSLGPNFIQVKWKMRVRQHGRVALCCGARRGAWQVNMGLYACGGAGHTGTDHLKINYENPQTSAS